MHEEESRKGRFAEFEYWLTNMFWYHYKWYFIVGVFVVSLLIMSVASFIKNVDYDWTVVYTHEGEISSEAAKDITRAFETVCTDVNENGKVQVKLIDTKLRDEKGSYSLYGQINKEDNIIFILDEAAMELYKSLGYFTELKYIESLGLWAGIRDNPIRLYTLEDFAGYNYTQADIDESNEYRQGEHDKLVAQAREALKMLN